MASDELEDLLSELWVDPSITPETVEEERANFDGMARPVPLGTTVTSIEIGRIKAEWVVSDGASPRHRLLYLHGGGYTMGSLASHRHLAAELSRLTGISVLLLGYRLAPEHPFPAALKDATEAFQWMQGNGPVGLDGCESSFIGGDSAGGGLTLATLLSLVDRGGAMPTAAITLSAWTDLALTGETLVSNADNDPVVRSVDSIRPIAKRYLDGVDPETPLASPLYGDPTGFPPLYMQVGEEEMLLSDTTRFAALARSKGVVVELDVVPEVPHFVQMFALEVPEGLAALERISGFVLRFLSRT